MQLLLTCFDPFGGESVNPSMELCALQGASIAGFQVKTLVLPTSFRRGPARLLEALDEIKPDAVLCIGQAGGRSMLSFERVGINWMEGRIADNDGFQPEGQPILPGAADAHFATLPVGRMAEAARAAGVPAQVSLSAGAFVCNCVLFSLLQGLKERDLHIPAGFLHVPFSPEQAAAKPACPPSMSLELMNKGLHAAIGAL